MSRIGNCWDKAVAESFFHTLKVELFKNEPLTDRERLKHQVFEYIEVDYNKISLHSAIGYLSPDNYELKNIA
jgi:putative transposase